MINDLGLSNITPQEEQKKYHSNTVTKQCIVALAAGLT